MYKPNAIAKCLNTAEEIAAYIKESPDRIKYLVENEGLPAWKRDDKGSWKALDIDLSDWLVEQRMKYLREDLNK